MKRLMDMALLGLASVLGSLFTGCASSPTSNTENALVHTSVCQLVANPEKFAGSRVHLKSMVRPSAHSVILLYDDNCKDAVVVLDVPSNLEGAPEIEKMMNLVWEGYPGPRASNVTIDLYGVYRWRKNEVPSRYIVAESVIDTAVR